MLHIQSMFLKKLMVKEEQHVVHLMRKYHQKEGDRKNNEC